MTDIEKSMVEEMKSLIRDQADRINDQLIHIEELNNQMADMVNREYDCWCIQ